MAYKKCTFLQIFCKLLTTGGAEDGELGEDECGAKQAGRDKHKNLFNDADAHSGFVLRFEKPHCFDKRSPLNKMKQIKALAEIAIDLKRGWVLPTFGSKKPDRFRYQAHAHFEKDATWGQRTWTLLVDLAKTPDAGDNRVEATVYFMVPEAPHHLLEEGAKFELLHGKDHYTHGIIKRVFQAEK